MATAGQETGRGRASEPSFQLSKLFPFQTNQECPHQQTREAVWLSWIPVPCTSNEGVDGLQRGHLRPTALHSGTLQCVSNWFDKCVDRGAPFSQYLHP